MSSGQEKQAAAIKRKPVARKPLPDQGAPQSPSEAPSATPIPLLDRLSVSDEDASQFTIKVISTAPLIEGKYYHIPGLNRAVDVARNVLLVRRQELEQHKLHFPGDEAARFDLATLKGVYGALGAFDNTGLDHFTFDDLRALFKFNTVREALTQIQAAAQSPGKFATTTSAEVPAWDSPPTSPVASDASSPLPANYTRPLDGSRTTEPLNYVSVPIVYHGDGAVAANAAVQTQTTAMNHHIWAHNRRVQGPPTGEILSYNFREKSSAIYLQQIADLGLSRTDFDDIVETIDSLRLATKKEVNKKWLLGSAVATVGSLGLLSFMFIGNVRKKSGDAMDRVKVFLVGVNDSLRNQGIPLIWQIKVGPFFLIEVTVTHSPV